MGNGTFVAIDEAKLWSMADALRNNMDAAEYKHVVLGLFFLKYISDAFEAKHAELEAQRDQGRDLGRIGRLQGGGSGSRADGGHGGVPIWTDRPRRRRKRASFRLDEFDAGAVLALWCVSTRFALGQPP